MATEWNLETIWIILIQGPLLILSNVGLVFQKLLGIDVVNAFNNGKTGFNIFYLYGPIILVIFTICIFMLFFKALKAKVDNIGETKRNFLNAFKYLFINLALVFMMPVLIFGIGLLLTTLSNGIYHAFADNQIGSNDLYQQLPINLYFIGYIGNDDYNSIIKNVVDSGFTPPSQLLYPAPSPLMNNDWNYFIEIIAVWISLFLPFYITFTFIQKIIEIFILGLFSPFSMINNMIDDGAKFKALVFQTFRKLLIVLWCVFCFIFFNLIMDAVSNWLNTSNELNKGIIYIFITLAIVVSLYMTTLLISRKLEQKIGLIGLYKSTKQTYNFQKDIFKPQEVFKNNELLSLETKIEENKKVIDQIKASVIQNNKQYQKLSNLDLFNK